MRLSRLAVECKKVEFVCQIRINALIWRILCWRRILSSKNFFSRSDSGRTVVLSYSTHRNFITSFEQKCTNWPSAYEAKRKKITDQKVALRTVFCVNAIHFHFLIGIYLFAGSYSSLIISYYWIRVFKSDSFEFFESKWNSKIAKSVK